MSSISHYIFFSLSGGRGMAALPLEPREVKKEDLDQAFPTPEVLQAWYRGEEAEWPPDQDMDDNDDLEMPPLRFVVGQKVFCRIGATQWAPGSIEQLWYREQGWPEGSWAPYKVLLDDGRNIFAPADVNQVIKAADDAT